MKPDATSPILQAAQISTQSPIMPPQPRLRPSPHRAASTSLRLPSLPRFHPANFPSSQHVSAGSTPSTGVNGLQPPVSPRQNHRQYSDVQKQLYAYQKDIIATAMRTSQATTPNGLSNKPDSPRLEPLGSPGPVTPLMLEEQAGYLVAGVRAPDGQEAPQDEVVESFIRAEARRREEMSPRQQPTPVVGR
ncbi:MAG: hypothetical protein M1820_006466 [Bogoriella megaspora]|nr:MAG: hypothetical protein M1820_006466 [Bogoriella megaspora]